jgi:hypothetical protein
MFGILLALHGFAWLLKKTMIVSPSFGRVFFIGTLLYRVER